MFKIIYMFFALTFLLYSQPTLNNDILPEIGTKITFMHYDTVGINSGSSGANQTWDFSDISISPYHAENETSEFVAPSEGFNANEFPEATIAEKGDTAYTFYKIDNNRMIRLGTGFGDGAEILSDYQTQLEIPFTFGDSFQDEFSGTTQFMSLNLLRNGTIKMEADAYGDITVGNKTYNNVLRLKTVFVIKDSLPPPIPGVPGSVITTTTTSYTWMKEGLYYPVFNISYGSTEADMAGQQYSNSFKNVRGIDDGNTQPTLSVPTQESPTDGASELEFPINLTWSESQISKINFGNGLNQSIEYEVLVSKDETFSSIDYSNSTNLLYESLSDEDLEYGATYYWKVKAVFGETESDWSDIWSFSVKEKSMELDAPELTSPEINSENVSVETYFRWNDVENADSYIIVINDSPEFTDPIFEENVTDSEFKPETDLEFNTNYYWKVKAVSGENESIWSQTWGFTTEGDLVLPGKAVLISPSNGATDVNLQPKLTWEDEENVIKWRLIVSDNSDLNTIIAEMEITDNYYQFNEDLTADMTYYWAVNAWNELGYGEQSDVFQFTTKSGSSVLYDENNKYVKIVPNPASESISIIEFEEMIINNAKIIDISGKTITTLNTNEINNDIDISYLSSGKYFIVLEGKSIITVPFIVE